MHLQKSFSVAQIVMIPILPLTRTQCDNREGCEFQRKKQGPGLGKGVLCPRELKIQLSGRLSTSSPAHSVSSHILGAPDFYQWKFICMKWRGEHLCVTDIYMHAHRNAGMSAHMYWVPTQRHVITGILVVNTCTMCVPTYMYTHKLIYRNAGRYSHMYTGMFGYRMRHVFTCLWTHSIYTYVLIYRM